MACVRVYVGAVVLLVVYTGRVARRSHERKVFKKKTSEADDK